MTHRLAHFERLGLPDHEAGRMADKLLLRDRDLDDRRVCLECQHLRGRPGAWRCPMPAPMVQQLQRCPAFAEVRQ
ncbi:hypothetical protein [Extensimonas vulgaris]|jgi:hypothetical protein|uniref:Uncharacterized protein n=1 Tax=Extensimonas vulgaris TaxID=1031594 RepID=A0A369AR36_9BURK|nr:hypothetical protein [Extensimonas vulgaris]RCX11842.1 hypothetical protein DFR45_101374 [Extensimonas vulgaris]TWI39067.1 hypothetical protein IP95_01614 [Extensimonas vulgaris]TXD15319.1 hypothetical protein FUT63_07360 [Extensimonas vulgaris]